MKKKFKLSVLGCRTNQYEAQAFRTQLIKLGLEEAKREEKADVCIVNTCSVTASAGRESVAQVRKLAQENEGARLIVTGCHAEELSEKMRGVEVVLNLNKESLLALLFPEEVLPEFAIEAFAGHTRAFVKVQDGCNSFCTYCIIPYVRGRSRSRRLESIISEVEGLVQNGYKEVVFTGINIGDFDGGLSDLVKAADRIDGLERIRLSSIDPQDVTGELAEVLLSGKKTSPSLHLVLQSGSNVILKKMNRKYTRQQFLEVANGLQKRCADFTFTTDVIIGFPGESQRDFEETLEVICKVPFSKVHMFPFSPRKKTRAATYLNPSSKLDFATFLTAGFRGGTNHPEFNFEGRVNLTIPSKLNSGWEALSRKTASKKLQSRAKETLELRRQKLLQVAWEKAYAVRRRFVGRKMKVLVESGNEGHTENFLPVHVEGETIESNEIYEVELIKNESERLVGRIV